MIAAQSLLYSILLILAGIGFVFVGTWISLRLSGDL